MKRVIAVLAAGMLLTGCTSAIAGTAMAPGSAGTSSPSLPEAGAGDAPQDVEDQFIAELMAAETYEDMSALWGQCEKNSPAFTYLYTTGVLLTESADTTNLV